MGKESDRIPNVIGCLETRRIPATLMSTTGFHCEVWQMHGHVLRTGQRVPVDVIIKIHKEPCSLRDVRLMHRDYRELKRRLGRIVPDAHFVATEIDGRPNVVVVAQIIQPWFNIANPTNEIEAVPLLRKLTMAQHQLRIFVDAARAWYAADGMRVIDLWGIDNLVLDRDRQVRYVDSFRVFFYADMLHLFEEVDEDLKARIDLSLQRLDYVEHLLRETAAVRVPSGEV